MRQSKPTGLLIAYGAWLLLGAGCNRGRTPDSANNRVANTVDATVLPQPQQTIKGWGCYPATYEIERPDAANYHIFGRPRVQHLLFKELGITFFRCNILPRSYDAVKDDGSLDTRYLDATLVRQIKIARSYGLTRYLLTVWSPPAIFKDPPVTTGWDAKTRRAAQLRADREDDYCRYVVRVLNYLTRQQHLPPPIAYSIQNEPGSPVPFWDGVAYGVEQWQRVVKKMRRALDSGGYQTVPLIGPEAGSYDSSLAFVGGAGAPALCHDQALSAALAGFAFHGYSATSNLAPYPQQMRDVANLAHSRGKDVWMTEWCISAKHITPLEHALRVLQRFGREMAYIPTNYWTWWQGWWVSNPKSEVLITGPDDQHLHISKTYRVFQQLWHRVPPGSRVKLVQTNDPALKGFDPYQVQTVAFDTGHRLVVLLINPTAVSKALTLHGLRGQRVTSFLTTAIQDMAAQPATPISNGTSQLKLPAQSIMVAVTAGP